MLEYRLRFILVSQAIIHRTRNIDQEAGLSRKRLALLNGLEHGLLDGIFEARRKLRGDDKAVGEGTGNPLGQALSDDGLVYSSLKHISEIAENGEPAKLPLLHQPFKGFLLALAGR